MVPSDPGPGAVPVNLAVDHPTATRPGPTRADHGARSHAIA